MYVKSTRWIRTDASVQVCCAYNLAVTGIDTETEQLADFLQRHAPVVVLTGAGISTESGIPAYRNDAGEWRAAQPIQHNDFAANEHTRRRYWLRSWYGWPRIREAVPSRVHEVLAELESTGHLAQIITQNVDGLHQRAGSHNVIDLHGRVDRVVCTHCDATFPRDAIQTQLAQRNQFHPEVDQAIRPDGDMEVDDSLAAELTLPECTQCNGVLKPDVVFFGGNVPRAIVEAAQKRVAAAKGMLAIGTSLQVFSGFRLVRQAKEAGQNIAIANPGITRGDALANLRLYSKSSVLFDNIPNQL